MKTLVNIDNPVVRINAPEIQVRSDSYYFLINENYGFIIPKARWTLVEEEPKHTEVWVEGRTIFEQDAKKPEVDLEKAAEEYIEKRASLAPNEPWNIEDMRDAVRFGAEWQKKQRNKELREKIDEYWNAGYEAGVEWQKEQMEKDNVIIRKDWFEHLKQSWYKQGVIDGKYEEEKK